MMRQAGQIIGNVNIILGRKCVLIRRKNSQDLSLFVYLSSRIRWPEVGHNKDSMGRPHLDAAKPAGDVALSVRAGKITT